MQTTSDTGPGSKPRTDAALIEAQEPILAAMSRWTASNDVDLGELRKLHNRASIAAHRHYVATIPAYRSLAESFGLADCTDADTIRAELSSTDDVFKSYDPKWLDTGDFAAMSRWLGQISSGRHHLDPSGIETIEDWIAALSSNGVTVLYSSGTSGRLSFVPRDEHATATFVRFASRGLYEFAGVAPSDLDAFLLGFRGGNHSLAWSADRVSSEARSRTFLYDFSMKADAIRAQVTGTPPASDAGKEAYEELRRGIGDVATRRERLMTELSRCAAEGRAILLFAASFQLLELCRELQGRGERLRPVAPSLVLIGGGWKSFEGERIERDELAALVNEWLGIPPERFYEAYGMTEASAVSFRCGSGRFHVPPTMWPMVFDDALQPLTSLRRGRFGFSDPFATSYPGFFITGDELELSDEPCACGRQGFSIVGEVGRAHGREAKGCGGVMASVRG